MHQEKGEQAIVSYVSGVFWARFQEGRIQIPAEQATSLERLTSFLEARFEGIEIRLNFPESLLPENEPASAKAIPVARVSIQPKPKTMSESLKASFRHRSDMYAAGSALKKKKPLICRYIGCSKTFEPRDSQQVFCSKSCAGIGSRPPGLAKQEIMIPLQCAHCKRAFERISFACNKGAKVNFCKKECKREYYREKLSMLTSLPFPSHNSEHPNNPT